MITDVSEGTILDAMKRFDKEYRNNADWLNWQNNKNHKYAIQRDGRLYPVKQIISMATGQPVSSFSGGDESNNYLANKGFKIVNVSPENETEQENGENSELQVRSWSRPAGIPNLIGRKKVDWSVFQYGTHIPLEFHQYFEAANGNKHLERGESHEVQLIVQGQIFSAAIYNINVRKTEIDTLQLRWDGKNDLKDLLISRLNSSYTYLTNARKIKEESGSSSYIKIPDYKAEYIDFISTDTPFTYLINFITFDNDDIDDGSTKTELDYSAMVSSLIEHIASQGYIFEPWQIATYVTALRTKPFVILAGVSGTGKSKLPALISEASGGNCHLIPVRPDWTDSSDVLGYCDLQGQFKPGAMLSIVREAANNPDSHFVCIMDEMNLARVEHYFAEVLSQVENRQADGTGKFFSGPLICQDLREEDEEWGQQVLPPNLAIVGTVNMDESAYGFSRKVLDRAFTLELSEIHLESWGTKIDKTPDINVWPVKLWFPRAINLNGLQDISVEDKQEIDEVITVLTEVNTILIQAQLQVGYRVRDEVALFVLHAEEIIDSFVTTNKMQVNPLDLALQMKILPRIIGGSIPIRKVVLQLLGWAVKGSKNISEEDAQIIIEDWDKKGRLTFLEKARYPRTAARLCLMWERLINEGFTSFWM